jgi:hypothetical protein
MSQILEVVEYRGRRLYWSDWRADPSTLQMWGVWFTECPGRDAGWLLYATTLGNVGECEELGRIDTTRNAAWPLVTAVTFHDSAGELKDRAFAMLTALLDRIV